MQGVETLNIQAPFPGLRSFESNEGAFFFGRERQLDELLRKLRSNRFLAVVGSSGNGKSSFINTMLIPRLEEGFNGQAGAAWRIATCSPGNNPLENLSRQLAQRNVLHGDEMMDPSYPAKIEGMLRNGSLGIVEAFKKSEVGRGENLIIVVDQFEEIFNFSKKNKRNEEDAATFVNLLLNASRQKDVPIYILLTMRSAHIGACAEFRGLAEAVNDGQFLIPRIKPEDLKRIIVNPVQHERCVKIHGVNAEIEESVVAAIVNDLGKNTDELATLQHCMLRMWNHWLDKEQDTEVPISLKHYKGVGTVKGAMARHAEEAYADLDTEEKRIICERIFRAMVEKGNEGAASSRAITVKEMMEVTGRSMREVRLVIYTFSQSGRKFLSAPPVAEIDEDSVISIAHESLIKRWSRLKGWANDETEAAEMYGRLCAAAALYHDGKGSLWKDPELVMGLKWYNPEDYDEDFAWRLPPNKNWASRYENPAIGYDKAIEFLLESQSATLVANDRIVEVVKRKENFNRRGLFVAIFTVLFCLIMMLWALWAAADARSSGAKADRSAIESRRQTYLAELSQQEAKRQKFYAELSKEKAVQQQSIAELANMAAMKAADYAEREARNANEAKSTATKERDKARLATEQAERDRELAIAKEAEANKAKEEAVRQREIAIKVKGLSLAQSIAVKSTKEEDEDIQGLLAKEAYDLNAVNEGDPQDAFIYEALYQALNTLEEVNRNNEDFNALDQAPDGRTRVGRIRHIQVAEGDGKIYTVGSDGLLLKWKFDVYGSKKGRKEKANKPEIISNNLSVSRTLDISPDGKYLARAGDADKILICDAENGQVFNELDAHKGKRIWALKYTPSGDGLVSVGDDGAFGTAINYTNMSGATSPIIGKTPHDIHDIDISSEGKYLAGIGKSSEVWIWNIQNQRREFLLNDPQSDKHATAVAFNPKGRFVAVGYQDGTMMVWDLNKSKEDPTYLPEKFLNHGSKISDVEFSDDGTLLVVGSLDKTATLWTIRDEEYRGYGNYKEFPYTNPKYHPIKLTNHDDWVTSVAFSNDGTKVITGTANGQLKLWEVDMTLYADQICDIIRQNLSDKSWKKYVGTDDPNESELYIETADGGRRIPFSTCGDQANQMKDARKLNEDD
jgi:WD40 repeat protein